MTHKIPKFASILMVFRWFLFFRSSNARTLPHGPRHSASRHQAGTSMTTDKNQKLKNGNGPKTNRSLSKARSKNAHVASLWTRIHFRWLGNWEISDSRPPDSPPPSHVFIAFSCFVNRFPSCSCWWCFEHVFVVVPLSSWFSTGLSLYFHKVFITCFYFRRFPRTPLVFLCVFVMFPAHHHCFCGFVVFRCAFIVFSSSC